MEIEKLINRLNGLYTALRKEGEQKYSPEINTVAFVLMDAASALSTLQAKNESLRAELEKVKKIMRENGIMVIPSKYPGGQAEWNIPKP